MDFRGIADYLNVPEELVRGIARRGVLPGRPSADDWVAEVHDIEGWYVQLTGKDWADLVSDGNVDPLIAEAEVSERCASARVREVLVDWRNIDIQSVTTEDAGSLVMQFTIKGPSQEEMQALDAAKAMVGARRVKGLEADYNCQRLLSQHKLTLVLSDGVRFALYLGEDLAAAPERDREVVRHRISVLLDRLLRELQGAAREEDAG